MMPRRPHNWDGEEKVIISLVMSLAMIILAALSWWLWKALAPIGSAIPGVSSVELP